MPLPARWWRRKAPALELAARATRAASKDFTAGHSSAITENIAESRSLPSSPGAQEADQLRSTPSKWAPSAVIARRDLALRASVLRSTRTTRSVSKAYVNSSSFASAFTPEPCADAASQVKPTWTADRPSRPGHVRRSK